MRVMTTFLALLLCVTTVVKAQRVCTVDLILAVDRSGSIWDDQEDQNVGRENWNQLRNFLAGLVDSLDESTQVALVAFSSDAQLIFNLGDFNKGSTISRIRNLPYTGGETHMEDAMTIIRDRVIGQGGDRDSATNVIIIVTDGKPTAGQNRNLRSVVSGLIDGGAQVLAVGITDDVDTSLMLELVSTPSDYFTAEDFGALDDVIDRLAVQACPPSSCQADIAMVIDESGSIEVDNPVKGNWDRIKRFLEAIIVAVDIRAAGTRVALITFGNIATQHFTLNRYYNDQEMLRYVANLENQGGQTNMTGALRHVERFIFVESAGDRRDVENVVILLTDGKPNLEQNTVISKAGDLKERGVRIIGVGVTNQTDEAEMRAIVSNQNTDYFDVDDFTNLQRSVNRIVSTVCNIVDTTTTSTTTTTTTTTTTRPPPLNPSECPDPVDNVYAFSAYVMSSEMMKFEEEMRVPFNSVYSNIGNGFKTDGSVFRCPCDGVYEFSVMMSDINGGMGVTIVMDGEHVSPLGMVRPDGALATSTIVTCRLGQEVYVEVMVVGGLSLMSCTYNGIPLYGFKGQLLAVPSDMN